MTETADKGSAHRPRQTVALVVIAVVAATSAAVAIANRGEEPAATRPAAGQSTSVAPTDVGSRDARAIALLAEQDRALARGNRSTYLRTWDEPTSAQGRAGTLFGNLAALRVNGLNARYVAADAGGLSTVEQRRLGGNAWTADVDIAWRLAGIDRGDARTTLTYTFVQRGDRVAVADVAAASGERTPIWLLGPLDVRRTPRTVVAATNRAQAERLDAALRDAVRDVQRVLPAWRGNLVSYGPSTPDEFDRLIAAQPGGYAGIAAVTTTVDGSRSANAPVAIVVNPVVFDGLGPIGAQVVMSHEATHVATDATTVNMPLWLAEGFADYVGVGSVDVPLSVSARAAIRDIRRFGLPDQLPSDAAFQVSSGVEATYEEAWLANRLIARDYGQPRLVSFYEDVLRHPTAVGAAMRRNLGTTPASLTRAWRNYLREVAHAG